MNLRERIEWVFRMGLLVFILAAAAFLSAVTTMRFAIQGREVTMPNLVGKSSADAMAILQGRGLQLKVVDRVYSDLPANSRSPAKPSGGRTHEGGPKCARRAQSGLSECQHSVARRRIIARRAHSVAAGWIATGRSDPPSPRPPQCRTPSCSRRRSRHPRRKPSCRFAGGTGSACGHLRHAMAGGNAAAGRRPAADSAGLKLAKTTFVPSPQWPKGAITEQTPEPGTKITSDSDVETVVAQ